MTPARLAYCAIVVLFSLVDLGNNFFVGRTRVGFVQWLLLLGICLFGLYVGGVYKKALRNLTPFLLALAYFIANCARSQNIQYAIVDVVYMAIPLFVYLLVYGIAKRGYWLWVHKMLLMSAFVPALIFGLSVPFGFSKTVTGVGIESLLGMRSIALYTTITAAVAFAWLSLGGYKGLSSARLPAWIAGTAVLIAAVTLSRTSLLVLFVYGLALAVAGATVRQVVRAAALVCLVGALVWFYQPLKDRVVPRNNMTTEQAIESGKFTSGRFLIWTAVFQSVLHSPYLGSGTGNSKVLVFKAYPDAAMLPHNEYLRFWHDGGLVGLALVFAPLIARLRKYRRQGFAALRIREMAVAGVCRSAYLMVLGMLVAAVFDNPFIYIFLTAPLFSCFACADVLLEECEDAGALSGPKGA